MLLTDTLLCVVLQMMHINISMVSNALGSLNHIVTMVTMVKGLSSFILTSIENALPPRQANGQIMLGSEEFLMYCHVRPLLGSDSKEIQEVKRERQMWNKGPRPNTN